MSYNMPVLIYILNPNLLFLVILLYLHIEYLIKFLL